MTGLVTRTLKAKYELQDDASGHKRVILCHSKNTREIYYQFEDEAAEPVAETKEEALAPAAPVAATPVAVATAPAASAAPAASMPDEPLNAIDNGAAYSSPDT